MLRKAAILLMFFVVCVCGRPALSQNLVANPSFDANLDEWTTSGGLWEIISEGSDPCARVEEWTGTGAFIYQCIPATGDHAYSFQARFHSDPGSSGDIGYQWDFFYGAGCSAGVSSGSHVLVPDLSTQWLEFGASARAPTGTQSTRVMIGPLAESQGVFFFDDIAVFMSLFDDDFEAAHLQKWSRAVP